MLGCMSFVFSSLVELAIIGTIMNRIPKDVSRLGTQQYNLYGEVIHIITALCCRGRARSAHQVATTSHSQVRFVCFCRSANLVDTGGTERTATTIVD
jgi:hypothetical protein